MSESRSSSVVFRSLAVRRPLMFQVVTLYIADAEDYLSYGKIKAHYHHGAIHIIRGLRYVT